MNDSNSNAREVVIDGQRYFLVPAEPDVEAEGPASKLTVRELEIVRLVARGLVNKQIAHRLDISEHTVATHLRRIYAKLHVDTRAAMVDRAQPQLQNGRHVGAPRRALG
jgi:ATP/maltotriose-dependent transcriptional regulator MalT